MIKAKKSLGQNFLVDGQVSRRIVDAVSPQIEDVVIEIGPGTGALTRLLAEHCAYVVALEIDARLVAELRRSITTNNLLIVEADALEVDWKELIARAAAEWQALLRRPLDRPRIRVVANLPYYISTPIIERLMKLGNEVLDMTLMLQAEVVERITSGPGGRDYGYMSVLVAYYCEAMKLFEVPPSAFRPAPKVWSAVTRLVVREKPAVEVDDEAAFFRLVRAAFAQRRKTISNNLKAAAAALKPLRAVEAALASAAIDPKRRAETLSLAEFARLYRALLL
jgi:16S rRNA (adenine1518-N6/adenine1519-N6)-dimethyltransferase